MGIVEYFDIGVTVYKDVGDEVLFLDWLKASKLLPCRTTMLLTMVIFYFPLAT